MDVKVLVIDDEKDLCFVLTRYLSQKHHAVDCAYTLEDGLEKIKECKPDLILLDNNLPDGLGWDEADKIHAKYPALKIALISGGEATIYSIRSTGLTYPKIDKPISLNSLEKLIESL